MSLSNAINDTLPLQRVHNNVFCFFVQSKIAMFYISQCRAFWYSVTLLYILQKFECFAIIIFCVLSTRFLPAFSCLIGSASFPWGRWCLSHVTLLFHHLREEETDGNADTSTVHRKSRITSIFHHLGKKKRRQF